MQHGRCTSPTLVSHDWDAHTCLPLAGGAQPRLASVARPPVAATRQALENHTRIRAHCMASCQEAERLETEAKAAEAAEALRARLERLAKRIAEKEAERARSTAEAEQACGTCFGTRECSTHLRESMTVLLTAASGRHELCQCPLTAGRVDRSGQAGTIGRSLAVLMQ
jgi:hypothetical protein